MLHKTKILLIGLGCLLALNVSIAQTINADSLFIRARDLAFAGEYDAARRACRELLAMYPGYSDAEILIGKIYVWEEKPDLARTTLIPLLNRFPDNYEIFTFLIDNAILDRNNDEAISYSNRALSYYPNDTEILYRKANAFFLKGDRTASVETINQILAINPNHAGANDLKAYMSTSAGYLYQQAAEEVKSGQHEQARETLRRVLTENPDHFDASLLMAYTYGWDGKYDSARLITRQLVKTVPDNNELLNLMIHVEIWNKKYITALQLVNSALGVFPNDQNFLYQKARIEYLMQDYWDALRTLEQLLAINSNHAEGKELYELINKSHKYKDYVFLENHYEYAEFPFLSRKFVQTLGLSKWQKWGTIIGKVNIGSEYPIAWGDQGFQYELEAYPKLSSSNYLFLNYAYSDNLFFPNHRTGFEFFQRLPKGFEASLGFRTIYWTSMTWIYTGSVSWMNKSHYIAFRPYLSQNSANEWNESYTLTYRYYFNPERDDYIYTLFGMGSYSDDFLHLNPNPGNSYMVRLGIHKFVHPRWNLLASAGYNYDDGLRSRWQGMFGVRYYFNMFRK